MSGLLVGCSSGGGSSNGGAPGGGATISSTPAVVTAPGADATTPDDPTDDPTDETTETSGAAPETAPVATAAGPLPAPEGDAFYQPPSPLPGDGPGDLIWARPLTGTPGESIGWQVLYRSESVAGEPIAVSGLVIAPATPTGPAEDGVVLSWAHGTVGMGDECAPSRTLSGGFSPETIVAGVAIARGWTFVATDYEGLGTPGVHPYLVGPSEGRGVLDIVRAASQIDGSGVSDASQVAIFGHSQGGHAALMAAEIAATYAPELDVVGTVAGAPPGDLARIAEETAASPEVGGGYGLMIRAGFLAAYPELSVTAAADGTAAPLLQAVGDTCTTEAFALASQVSDGQPNPADDPAWRAALDQSSPGAVAPSGPVLVFHGDEDTTVPPELSLSIRDRYCALGVPVQRTVYEGQDHGTVVIAAVTEIQRWIADRLDGVPAPENCTEDQRV